jgi:deoxycytidylate deaminase
MLRRSGLRFTCYRRTIWGLQMTQNQLSVVQTSPADKSKDRGAPKSSRSMLKNLHANEFIFGVVGPVGSGTSLIATSIQDQLKSIDYETHLIKASQVIAKWAEGENVAVDNKSRLDIVISLQNAGDQLRETTKDNAAVARHLAEEIRYTRAKARGLNVEANEPVEPDGDRRAYILDSIRHPDEVRLLRQVYGEAFCLVAVVCPDDVREQRLTHKFNESGITKIKQFMERDRNAPEKHGQKVADAFFLADFFIDNSHPKTIEKGPHNTEENPDWIVAEELTRLIDLLHRSKVIRPRANEYGMYHAFGARMRSSCLSRQVGAALLDGSGNVISTGTNEVPKAGGGLYGNHPLGKSNADPDKDDDYRCFVHNRYCSNTKLQNELIIELLSNVLDLKRESITEDQIRSVRKTKIGQLIEFSRAVHAEMDALLSAARKGASPIGSTMYVTTYPCHNCARHIVSAGVDEVQYIEPYLKSRAIELHGDAITETAKGWLRPSASHQQYKIPIPTANYSQSPKVLFRPFCGVAPRFFRRAFLKAVDLKDDFTGEMSIDTNVDDAVTSSGALRVGYAGAEAALSRR